jgi:phage terminase large subunit-like protein
LSSIKHEVEILRLLELQRELVKYSAIDSYFPATGPNRRELYPKHLEFFESGTSYRERAFIAANRVGKTQAGAYEMTLHLTGNYPDWWNGRRFDHPVVAWASGDTSKTTREIIQLALIGRFHEQGTGMIPRDKIARTTTKTGIADCLETIYVRHSSGMGDNAISEVGLKSYDQQREAFQGTNRHIIWLDEEPPADIYTECLLRGMVVNGQVLVTATPLQGMTEVMRAFIQPGEIKTKFFVQATWDDVPHLDAAAKQALLTSIPPYQREARSKGVPQLGAGAIYQVAESDIVVTDFPIPDHYPRAYGLDVGWNKTAAIWGARDNETGVVYLYSEHYAGHQQVSLHAESIAERGKWIPGVIDPASQGSSQTDGEQLINLYRRQGLKLQPAVNAVETGIYATWQLMSAGKLKVFKSLGNWLSEFRLYQRDKDGKVLKQFDHLMDATRYLVMSGFPIMQIKPADQRGFDPMAQSARAAQLGIAGGDVWMM